MTAASETTPGALQPEKLKRVDALDGVRGLAILLVLQAHCYLVIKFLASPEAAPHRWFEELFLRTIELGWMGVDLFFVLSGFLITGILLKQRAAPHYFRRFYVRRALRILPLYYGVLALYFFVMPASNIPGDAYPFNVEHQAWYWLGGQNILFAMTGATGGLLGIYWSLAIEEQFYLVWPFLVRVLSPTAIGAAAVGLIVTSVGLRLGFARTYAAALYTLTASRLDGLALGCLLALVAQSETAITRLARMARYALPASVFGFIALLFGFGHFDRLDLSDPKISMHQPYMQQFGFLILNVAFTCIVVLAVAPSGPRWLQRVLRSWLLRVFGQYSYAIYMLHFMIFGGLAMGTFGVDRFMGWLHVRVLAYLALCIVYCFAALLIAFIIWHVFEKHFLNLKDRLGAPRKAPVHAGEAHNSLGGGQ